MCVQLVCFASMQREIAWMALKQVATLWIIAMTGVFVAALVSLYEFGVHRSTWVDLPVYIGCALFYPLIAMADALGLGSSALLSSGVLLTSPFGYASAVSLAVSGAGQGGNLAIEGAGSLQTFFNALYLAQLLFPASCQLWFD
jgi:hypothetical protein